MRNLNIKVTQHFKDQVEKRLGYVDGKYGYSALVKAMAGDDVLISMPKKAGSNPIATVTLDGAVYGVVFAVNNGVLVAITAINAGMVAWNAGDGAKFHTTSREVVSFA